ncbi:hypothetical protein [Thiolinea disciformis]|uniref:hypothetical protein n=1 Tax=Thiolinea disciformis TaxID=125614 RepID=UPI0012FF5100|nr:hypothetical protein [Thiolinea disciformis]
MNPILTRNTLKHLPHTSLFIITALILSACITQQATKNPNTVEVYKHRGSKQCEGGGLTQLEVEQQLSALGATIYKKSCATDGKTYPAYCGNADGKIYVFTIDKSAAEKARAQGFGLKNNLGLTPNIGCTI